MASVVNITVDQGSTFSYLFELQGTITPGSTAFAAMKKEYFSNDTPIPFGVDLTGANLTITMSSGVTSNLTPGTWVYDALVVDASNVVIRTVEGRVKVTPRVTPFP